MKKNFITHLQEYDARTPPKAKLDKYRKKFTKTVYQKDKQNIHPNLPSQQMKKSHKEKKDASSKCKSNQNSRQNTQNCQQKIQQTRSSFATKKKQSRSKQLLKESYGNLKMQCVALQRQIMQKHEEQIEKCRKYYEMVHDQLQQQEKRCINIINSLYQTAIDQVDKANNQLDVDMKAGLGCPRTCVEVDLLEVMMGQEMRAKIRHQLQQLDILNMIHPETQQKSSSSICGLQCSEELRTDEEDDLDHRPTLSRKWYQKPYFDQDCPIVYEATESEEGVSPSFKQF